MNELEKMLLAAILKQGVKEEDTNKEQKKEAVKQAGEVLKKANLDFAVLALSANTGGLLTTRRRGRWLVWHFSTDHYSSCKCTRCRMDAWLGLAVQTIKKDRMAVRPKTKIFSIKL
ncbi:hypothetical protein [Ligilactobacillus murinus]|uniref:hypothetical protein n=1 Tax=Ligilactobacillus murinus TaxID=1622 RepID=UPI00129841E4|nr:hypothetical protein [Ligilactobacillus murinus]